MLAFINNPFLTGKIRAEQISIRMNRPLDPTNKDDYRIIFVKYLSDNWSQDCYFDILDNYPALFVLDKLPQHVGVICHTMFGCDFLRKTLVLKRNIEYIPVHHCNFDRIRREDREVRVVGYIGGYHGLIHNFKEWSNWFKNIGLEFRELRTRANTRVTREELVDFYKNIDIQLFFRPPRRGAYRNFRDALKLVNGGSFGIPTLCFNDLYPTTVFPGYFLPVNTVEDVMKECIKLKDDKVFYNDFSEKLYHRVEDWHIDNVIQYYLKLENKE